MDFLTPTQVVKLLQHLTNERHRLQVLLMGDGGLRVSEMITRLFIQICEKRRFGKRVGIKHFGAMLHRNKSA
jgi:hypothetical protein